MAAAVRPTGSLIRSSPITTYGRHKAEAEQAVGEAHPHAVIVRTSLIYGGPQPSRHEQTALDVAAGRASLAFYTDELRCPVAVADLAAALLSLVDSTFTGIVHIAGADAVSRWEFASLVTGSEQLPSARSADRGGSPTARLPARHLALPDASADATSRRARGAQGASRSMTHAPCSTRYRKRSCRRASPCCQNS